MVYWFLRSVAVGVLAAGGNIESISFLAVVPTSPAAEASAKP